jgi:hypothetical protein
VTEFDFGAGPVPAHRHANGGGWVADSATVADSAYVGPNARVYDKARVAGEARVYGEAQVFGEAWVYGEAQVFGEARVFGEAQVYGEARVGAHIIGYPLDGIPIVTDLDKRIAEAVANGSLEMSDWHTCATTHCRAGWAITLAGEAGAALEKQVGPWLAGALIYVASTGRTEVPNFFASNEEALVDIKARAM